jgi:hypothetical protein
MSAWFASGQVVDVVLVLMLLEGGVLALIRMRSGRGLPLAAIATLLASGGALMLALRAALVGARWEIVSACMLVGLGVHLIDIAGRWD